MPQLDLYSYFSAATTLVLGFLFLVFVLHTYFLPKIATALKIRKKIQHKQAQSATSVAITAEDNSKIILNMAQNYVNELEKVLKTSSK